MRVNTIRLGLILLIIGVVLLFNVWTVPVIQTYKTSAEAVAPGETFEYFLFMAPVGLGNLFVDGNAIVGPPTTEGGSPIWATYDVCARLVVVSPSNSTLVDVEIATQYYSVPINFDERGEYVIYVTNMGDETIPIPIGVQFSHDGNVVYREADKFLVGIILTVSGTVLFCLSLSTYLIAKHKKLS